MALTRPQQAALYHSRRRRWLRSGGEWNPTMLPGLAVWYDPSDTSSLFQEATGGAQAEQDGDPVGLCLDKSRMGGRTAAAFIAAQPELVANGDFQEVGTWIVGDHWTVGGGAATKVPGGGEIGLDQTIDLTSGEYYFIKLNVVDVISGSIFIRLGNEINVREINSSGEFSIVARSGAASDQLRIVPDAGFSGTVVSVSVKHAPGAHLTAQTAFARPILADRRAKRVLNFQGTNQFMSAASPGIGLGSLSVWTLVEEQIRNTGAGIVTIAPTIGSDADQSDGISINTGGDWFHFHCIGGKTQNNIDLSISAGDEPMPLALWEFRKTLVAGEILKNGILKSTDDHFDEFSSASGGDLVIGARFNSGVVGHNFLNGDIYGVAISNYVSTSPQNNSHRQIYMENACIY